MPTVKQTLGAVGETIVAKTCHCPKCKRLHTLKREPKRQVLALRRRNT